MQTPCDKVQQMYLIGVLVNCYGLLLEQTGQMLNSGVYYTGHKTQVGAIF